MGSDKARTTASGQQLMAMLNELLELDEGLTDYEVGFVEDISHRVGENPRLFASCSDKQVNFLEDLWQKRQ